MGEQRKRRNVKRKTKNKTKKNTWKECPRLERLQGGRCNTLPDIEVGPQLISHAFCTIMEQWGHELRIGVAPI